MAGMPAAARQSDLDPTIAARLKRDGHGLFPAVAQQWVRSVALDCDGDTVLVKVDQVGAACHTGERTCFDADVLPAVVLERPAAVDRAAP